MTEIQLWRIFPRVETKLAELFQELDRGSAVVDESLVSSSPAPFLPQTQVINRPKRREISVEEKRERVLKNLESDLLRQSMEVVSDTMRFREVAPPLVDPESGETLWVDNDLPAEWVRELGEEKARERLRVARAGWMDKKTAPIGVQVAQVLAVGIIRSRATEKAGPRTLNVQVVQMSAPLPTFPELDLTGSDK